MTFFTVLFTQPQHPHFHSIITIRFGCNLLSDIGIDWLVSLLTFPSAIFRLIVLLILAFNRLTLSSILWFVTVHEPKNVTFEFFSFIDFWFWWNNRANKAEKLFEFLFGCLEFEIAYKSNDSKSKSKYPTAIECLVLIIIYLCLTKTKSRWFFIQITNHAPYSLVLVIAPLALLCCFHRDDNIFFGFVFPQLRIFFHLIL